MIWCYDCEQFGEPIIETDGTGVYAPDGVEEKVTHRYCPHCGSGDVEETKGCDLCGADMIPCDDNDYCEDCIMDIYSKIDESFVKLHERYGDYYLRKIYDCITVAIDKWCSEKWNWLAFRELNQKWQKEIKEDV